METGAEGGFLRELQFKGASQYVIEGAQLSWPYLNSTLPTP